jgi:hypothetical protein
MKENLKTIGAKIKLKKGSLAETKAWALELNNRIKEAMETLRDEGVYLETVFLDRASDADYLIYFMKVLDIEKAGKIAQKSKHAIDVFHQQFKKNYWVSSQPLELLIDFDRYEELS